MVTSQLERFGDRVGNRRADTTANHSNPAEVFDLGWISKGSQNIMNGLARLECVEHHGAFPDGLDDQRDRAGFGVMVNNGQRNTLTTITKA